MTYIELQWEGLCVGDGEVCGGGGEGGAGDGDHMIWRGGVNSHLQLEPHVVWSTTPLAARGTQTLPSGRSVNSTDDMKPHACIVHTHVSTKETSMHIHVPVHLAGCLSNKCNGPRNHAPPDWPNEQGVVHQVPTGNADGGRSTHAGEV